jgi:hypothetical protein
LECRIAILDYKEKTRAGVAASDKLVPGQGVPANGWATKQTYCTMKLAPDRTSEWGELTPSIDALCSVDLRG